MKKRDAIGKNKESIFLTGSKIQYPGSIIFRLNSINLLQEREKRGRIVSVRGKQEEEGEIISKQSIDTSKRTQNKHSRRC